MGAGGLSRRAAGGSGRARRAGQHVRGEYRGRDVLDRDGIVYRAACHTGSANRTQKSVQTVHCGFLPHVGGFILRINSFLVGYETGPGWHYFPSVPEIMVSIGMIALEILATCAGALPAYSSGKF